MNRADFRIVHVVNPNCNDTAFRDYYCIEKRHWLWGWRRYGGTTYGELWIAKEDLERLFTPATKTVVAE